MTFAIKASIAHWQLPCSPLAFAFAAVGRILLYANSGLSPPGSFFEPQGRAYPRWSIGPVLTASNCEPGTRLSWSRSSSLQRGLGAPVMYQGLPLSATISP